MKRIATIGLFAVSLLVLGCNKQPGPGGKASISGTVMERHYNSISDPNPTEYPATDKRVYIIYGDDVTYSDRIDTGPTGEFEFKGLRKGLYTIYVYSDDPDSPTNPQISIQQEVEITEGKQSISIPDLTVHDF